MRALVTGGAGFIGSNLVRRLQADGWDVVVIDDCSTGTADNLDGVDDVVFHQASVLDPAILDAAMAGADTVVHLAALGSVPRSIADPAATHRANVEGTLAVLEAVRRAPEVPHLVVASSSSVYGAGPGLPRHEDQRAAPVSPYAATKVAVEAYCQAWATVWGLPVLTFRFFNVFGPRQAVGHVYAAVVPAFVAAALEGRPLPVHGDGSQTRDFTYVGSVCDVVADAAARRVAHPEPVNLAFGSRVSLLELVAGLEAVLGRALDVEHQPFRHGDVAHTQADTARLRAMFPDATPVGLVDGLRNTVEWYRSR
ncbi:MAG: NAD-dependent epimerase/dehydratase family protein [Acidimicrobiia bacterium]